MLWIFFALEMVAAYSHPRRTSYTFWILGTGMLWMKMMMMMMMMMMVWMKMVTMVMNVFVHANALFITSSSGEAWMLFFMKAQSSTVGTIVHMEEVGASILLITT